MAKLVIGSDEATLVLGRLERMVSFHRDLHLPLRAVVRVSVPPNPWMVLRGWRSTGIGILGYSALGVRRHGSGWDFVAVSKQQAAVLIELNAGRYGQVLVSVADAERSAAELTSAAGIGR